MAKFKINVYVEFTECDDVVSKEPILNDNGSFSMTISENSAISIDKVEKSVLQTAYPTIRKAVEQHLSDISKKKALEQGKGKGQIVTNSSLYQVDGEIGRFSFATHNLVQDDKIQFNTAQDIFKPLKSREIYKTAGFKDMAMIYGDTDLSFLKTVKLINHVRYQETGGTPSRTLHECTESEGRKIQNIMEEKTATILATNGFSPKGECLESNPQYANQQPETIQLETIKIAAEKYCIDNNIDHDLLSNPVPYEDTANTTNVAIDDVVVKKQEEKRESGKKDTRGKRKYVHNTISHISKEDKGSYVLNGHNTRTVLLFVTAFLLSNKLIGTRIQFFTDGHKTLNETILKMFSWYKNIGIILDWYHLVKKCKEQLSMASKGRVIRNEILDNLKPLLWCGSTDMAIAYLEGISSDLLKNKVILKKLIEYLQRNKPYTPCYAVRKELGLCNSSAISEKMNDIIVSKRQKHNGMSWSKAGSVSLATISALKRNKESDKWFEEEDLEFKLAA